MVLLNVAQKFHIEGISKPSDFPAIGEGAKSDFDEEQHGPHEAQEKEKCEDILTYRSIATLT
jgi:hypothetical protein